MMLIACTMVSEMPYALSILSIFSLWSELKTFLEVYESEDTFEVLLGTRKWDVVESSARNPFWFCLNKGSIWGRHRFSMNQLNILDTIDVRLTYLVGCFAEVTFLGICIISLIDHSHEFSPLIRVPLHISSSMMLYQPVFDTSAGRPAAFPFDIFWSTFCSSSFIKVPISLYVGKVVSTMSSISSSGLLAIRGEPRSAEK